jgi:hypothetical protein
MSFAELLAELAEVQELKKSLPTAGGEGNGVGEGGENQNPEALGKSMTVTTEDGEQMEAVDGTALVKSLIARVETMEAGNAAHGEDLTKSLGMIKDAMLTQTDVIKAQGEMIKSLQANMATLMGAGHGRKSIVTVHEKPDPTLTKSVQAEGLTRDEFMAKALDKQKEGKLTSREVAIAEASLNRGIQVPDHITRKVVS